MYLNNVNATQLIRHIGNKGAYPTSINGTLGITSVKESSDDGYAETSISVEMNVNEPYCFTLNDNSSDVLYVGVSFEQNENTCDDNGSHDNI